VFKAYNTPSGQTLPLLSLSDGSSMLFSTPETTTLLHSQPVPRQEGFSLVRGLPFLSHMCLTSGSSHWPITSYLTPLVRQPAGLWLAPSEGR